ncbi:MAG: helix-turn-helix transcriptional regulator [Ktedonobacterales bacterium]
MAQGVWEQRFFASTRGHLIALLRRGTQTVDGMAAALELTDNAVRAQLAALERDGLVRQSGVRRCGGSGKPAFEYSLTAQAERLFPKPYAEALGLLTQVLAERLPPEDMRAIARETGQRLARRAGGGAGGGDRVQRAVVALNEMGGLAELEERGHNRAIRAFRCPFGDAVADYPTVCELAEALVAGLTGEPVRVQCARGEYPCCVFQLESSRDA